MMMMIGDILEYICYKKMTPVRTSSYNDIIDGTPGGDVNVTLVTFQKDQSGHLFTVA